MTVAVTEDTTDTPTDADAPDRRANVIFNSVKVISSCGDHPDDNPFERAYYGNYPTTDAGVLAAHYVLHRRSDGQIKCHKNRDEVPGNELTIMLLGQFDPRGQGYLPVSDRQLAAVGVVVHDFKRDGLLAEDAEIQWDLPAFYNPGTASSEPDQGDPEPQPNKPEPAEPQQPPNQPDQAPAEAQPQPQPENEPKQPDEDG